MLPSNIFFGDIIYINASHNTLAAFSVHSQPCFVSLNESIRTPFRNAHFQIFPASFEPLSKLSKKYAKESVSVKVGSQVMFCHAESKLYLAVSAESDDSQAQKKLVLVNSFMDSAVFKFNCPSNLTVKDDNILYDDLIQIQSEKFEQFLSLGDVYIDKNYLNAASSYTRTTNDFPRIMPRRIPNDFLGSHYTAVLSDNATDLKLGRYRSVQQFDNQQNVILNGDYVRIRYIDKWMTYYPNQDKKKDIYFENINDRFQSYNYIHSIFQIIDEQSILAEPIILGSSQQYVLKHFVTGSYIHFDSPTSLKAHTEISQSDSGSPYCHFESESTDSLITEKLPLRIKFPTKQEYDAYIRPTEPVPVKNVQFEINTLYFFGFKIPEEYSYKNLKNLTRVLAEVSNAFEIEEYNIVLEKVSSDEMKEVIEMEQFANELQMLVDLISIPSTNSSTQVIVQEVNRRIKDLLSSSRSLLDLMSRSGKLIDEEEKENSQTKKYQLEIADKHIQALVREFRIFDLIHMINFLLMKKVPKNIEGDAGSEKFDTEQYLELYELFSKIILNSLYENTSNRFYNSQYIRIYIHFMSDSCDGVFKKDENEQLAHRMRYITLGLLKMLLWDEDLDGLGQLNFYQSMIFNAMKSTKNYETYYAELLEHISSSKAYNLINSFRDAFTTTVLTVPDSFKATFPLISFNDNKELMITFERGTTLQIPLNQLKSNEEAYNYFIVAFRLIVALSTSKFMAFYHEFIKHFPLSILQAVLKHPEIALEVKMLVHLVILYVYFDYMKLPFSFIPPLIQTSNDQLRQALNQEEKKIVDFCKTCIGSFEGNLLKTANIYEEVNSNINNLNTQDCSQQINFLELFLSSEPSYQSVQVAVFYIQSAIQSGNLTIHFLNKTKEVLIFIRKMYQNTVEKELQIIPDLMELFALVNQKMKTHSIIAIYNQVIKTQNPNAEVYSGKIIAGLKKIHLDSFAPIDMIALNEPVISGVALRYLTDVAKYENSIADELDKFVILSSMKDVEILKETIDIALTLNQHTRQYYFQKEHEGQITLEGAEYVKNIELLERLLTFIYNPAEHFLFADDNILNEALIHDIQNPTARFFRILRKEKVTHRDQPFLIRPEAISKLQQRIFSLLSIQDILLRLLNCTITLTVQNRPPESPAEVYQTRLILVILIAFVYKNRSNQDLLAKSHGFVSLYYQQKYIDKSCDSLTLFAEVMRENEELLEISKKFIYDITCYTFLGTIKPRAINKDSGAYLCTAIMSLHYLHKADIPLVTFDTFTVAEGKLDDLLKNDFPNLNLLTKIQEKAGQATIDIEPPACYYNIREMLESLCGIVTVCNKEGKKEPAHRLREKFDSQRFIKGFMKPYYRFQFELKNCILKCINKMNFWKHDINTNFFNSDNPTIVTSLFAYLINELLEFLNFSEKNVNKTSSQNLYEKFSQEIEALESNAEDEEGTDASLKEVQKSYEEFKGHNLSQVKQTIFMDELPVPIVWEYLYIFSECWKFIAKLCVTYPETIQATKLFEYFLSASEQLVCLADLINFNVLRKLRKYFTKMEDLAQYDQFREKIKEVKELIVGKHEVLAQEKDMKDSKKHDKNIEEPTEKVILKTIIEHMRANKQKALEGNLEMFSQILSSHSARRNIISELLSVIEYNPANLSKETTSFVASFLKLYLQKTLPEDPNECSDNHYAAFYKIQQECSEMDAEKRLVNGISVVRSAKNMKEIFKLILTYTSGGNLKVIGKLKKSLSKIKDKLLWSNHKEKRYEETVTFILSQIVDMISTLNDNELTKFIEYCIRSHKELLAPENDEIKAISKLSGAEQSDLLKKKMQSFFQEYANKDKDDVYKELGPLPVCIDTLLDIFRVSSDDTASLKIAKHTINKSIKEGDLKNALSDYFQKRININKDNLEFIRIDGTLILDLLISTVKYGMLVSE